MKPSIQWALAFLTLSTSVTPTTVLSETGNSEVQFPPNNGFTVWLGNTSGVNSPSTCSIPIQRQEILKIELNDLGQVYVEQQPVVALEQLKEKVQTYYQRHPNGLMALYASPLAIYNQVVQVLNILRESGGSCVRLQFLTPATDNPNNPSLLTPVPLPAPIPPGRLTPSTGSKI